MSKVEINVVLIYSIINDISSLLYINISLFAFLNKPRNTINIPLLTKTPKIAPYYDFSLLHYLTQYKALNKCKNKF